jgi:phage I-like protein
MAQNGTGKAQMEFTDLATAYAKHTQLHLEYAAPQLGERRRASLQGEHKALVEHLAVLGGVHIGKGDLLDETLPADTKAVLVARYVSPLNIALSEETGPGTAATTHTQVLRTGVFYHPVYGKFTITLTDLATMVNNFKLNRPKAPTEMVVDYEHMSAPGTPAQVAPAAGWVKTVVQEGNALFCDVEWTGAAADQIRKKEYRFISPEFTLNYRDKETNKAIGPTLLAVALTNRPFVEGMQPVALREQATGAFTLALSEQAAKQVTQHIKAEETLVAGTSDDTTMLLADWDTNYMNNLPDSAFAYIKPGGEKDADGNTVPRSLRFLPYKNRAGEIDLPHLRNALARLPQTDLTAEEKAKAQGVLDKAAKAAGVGAPAEEATKKTKEATLDEKELRRILKLDEKASIPEALAALVARAEAGTEAEKQLNERKAKDLNDEAIKLVDAAITNKKLLPKQKDSAVAMCLKDKAGFAAFVEAAPVIGPDTKEAGSANNNTAATITATEKKVAAQVGVTDEMLLKVKAADAAKPGAATV